MNPPVRGAEHRDGVWRGIAQGVVDVLGSDHAPHTLEEKAKPYPQSPSGMTGVQTLVPDHARPCRGGAADACSASSTSPAPGRRGIFGIVGKGRIAAGYDADFTIVDLKRARDDPRLLDRLALRLDALRRQDGHRLAGRDDPCAGAASCGRAN